MKGMKNMKKIVMIIVMLSAVLIGTAQNYKTAPIHDPAIKSHQIMQTGAAYQGTVYEPFGESAPSDYHPVAGEQASGGKPNVHVRKGFDTGAEYGRPDEYPLGDAVLPMLLCALAFGFVIARRRKHAE